MTRRRALGPLALFAAALALAGRAGAAPPATAPAATTAPSVDARAHTLELARGAADHLHGNIRVPAQAELRQRVEDRGEATLFELLSDPDPDARLAALRVFRQMDLRKVSPAAIEAERRAIPFLVETVRHPPKGNEGLGFAALNLLSQSGPPGIVALAGLLDPEDRDNYTNIVRRLHARARAGGFTDVEVYALEERLPALVKALNGDAGMMAQEILAKMPASERLVAQLRAGMPDAPSERFLWFVDAIQPRNDAVDSLYLLAYARQDDGHAERGGRGSRSNVDYRRALRSSAGNAELRRGALMYVASREEVPDDALLDLIWHVPLGDDARAAAAAGRVVCMVGREGLEALAREAVTGDAGRSARAKALLQIASAAPPPMSVQEYQKISPLELHLPGPGDVRTAELFRAAALNPATPYRAEMLNELLVAPEAEKHLGPAMREVAIDALRNGGPQFIVPYGELPPAPGGNPPVAWSTPVATTSGTGVPAPTSAWSAARAMHAVAFWLAIVLPAVACLWLTGLYNLRPRRESPAPEPDAAGAKPAPDEASPVSPAVPAPLPWPVASTPSPAEVPWPSAPAPTEGALPTSAAPPATPKRPPPVPAAYASPRRPPPPPSAAVLPVSYSTAQSAPPRPPAALLTVGIISICLAVLAFGANALSVVGTVRLWNVAHAGATPPAPAAPVAPATPAPAPAMPAGPASWDGDVIVPGDGMTRADRRTVLAALADLHLPPDRATMLNRLLGEVGRLAFPAGAAPSPLTPQAVAAAITERGQLPAGPDGLRARGTHYFRTRGGAVLLDDATARFRDSHGDLWVVRHDNVTGPRGEQRRASVVVADELAALHKALGRNVTPRQAMALAQALAEAPLSNGTATASMSGPNVRLGALTVEPDGRTTNWAVVAAAPPVPAPPPPPVRGPRPAGPVLSPDLLLLMLVDVLFSTVLAALLAWAGIALVARSPRAVGLHKLYGWLKIGAVAFTTSLVLEQVDQASNGRASPNYLFGVVIGAGLYAIYPVVLLGVFRRGTKLTAWLREAGADTLVSEDARRRLWPRLLTIVRGRAGRAGAALVAALAAACGVACCFADRWGGEPLATPLTLRYAIFACACATFVALLALAWRGPTSAADDGRARR